MANLSGRERATYVQGMFTRIARRYDVMNRLMTAGQDVRWRQEVIRRARVSDGQRLLDLGAGTGDLAVEALRQSPRCKATAADFTLAMMQIGQLRGRKQLTWSGADALLLPFEDECYDAVVSGFLLRNVSDLPLALSEQRRVLKPGGRIVSLDTTRPPQGILRPFINFHLHTIIPFLGKLISGEADAYTYLPDTTAKFLDAESLADAMSQAGFREVAFERRMLGSVAIHWGSK